MYDLVIVGAGPAGIFTALEMQKKGSRKRILIVDDVISTGESLAAMEELLHTIGGQVVGKACVLAEGDAKDRTDIIYLEPLPLFFK